MCGIVGVVGEAFEEAHLRLLHHRGPDGRGLEQLRCAGREIWIGHTRLAILDLSAAGRQPMRSRDGRWWVSYNGEIYNHLDLRRELEGPFRGHADTETLVELLAAQGVERTLPKLNGMFAFAALDTAAEKLYLVRDPFGIKPLYYAQDDGRFAFASEARVLRALGFGERISARGLRRFLTLRYVPSPETLWEGIFRLPPGHVLELSLENGRTRLWRFIRPVRDRFQGSFEDGVAAYRQELRRAVARQLLSDVPVGVLLSGGVDSALVAAMAKEAGADPPCFTVGFGEEHAECEIEDARHTARVLGLPFHPIRVSPEQMREALPAIVEAVEEPLGTTSVMPMWYLVRRAREDVTVVLTGQGADEPWGGYFRYQVGLVRERLPWPLLWRLLERATRAWHAKPEAVERGLRALAAVDEARSIVEACALFPAALRRELVGDAEDGGAEEAVRAWLGWLQEVQGLSITERMMRLDARMNLADDLLLYGDKIAMSTSLEARVPFLDLELVRLVESFPPPWRVRWRQGKVLHKAMAERYLPAEIVHRPKRGFQVPFGDWSRGIWREWLEGVLLEGLEGLLETSAVQRLWREHLDARPDRSRQMFALLMLALWNQAQRRVH